MSSTTTQILVPIDVASDSILATSIAKTIARPGDEIVFIHVIPLLDTSGVLLPKSVSVDSIARSIRAEAEQRLERLTATASVPEGVRVTSVVLDGNPGEEIVAVASNPGVRLIVMETAGKGAASRMMLGSVADHVARSSPVPVLLARHTSDGFDEVTGFKRIVVPIDGSARSRVALPVVADMAARLEVPVQLLAVLSLDRYAYLYGAAYSIAAVDEFEAEEARHLRGALEAIQAELGAHGIKTTSSLLSGAIAPSIEDQLEPGDLVVMASHGRSGVRRWLLGSVTEHLVRKGSAPVLIVPGGSSVEPGSA